MSSFRVPALFSLFRQRGPRELNIGTRYYDPLKERREELLKRHRRKTDAEALRETERTLLAERMRHSWRRQSSDRSHIIRLVLIMGMVIAILYFIARGFGLLAHWNA